MSNYTTFPKDKRPNASKQPLTPRLAPNAVFNTRSAAAPKLATSITPATSSVSSSPVSRTAISSTSSYKSPLPRLAQETPNGAKNISPNVTPRSQARRSKADSYNSTPTTVGVLTPRDIDRNRHDLDTLSSPPQGQNIPEAQHVHERQLFFHADDLPSPDKPQRPALPEKNSSFMYANGIRDGEVPRPQSPAMSQNSSMKSGAFQPPGQPATSSKLAADTMSAVSSHPPRSAPAPLQTYTPHFFRSPSPEKNNLHLSYRKGVSQVMRPQSQADSHSLENQPAREKQRQSSVDSTGDTWGHTKFYSVSSVGSVNAPVERRRPSVPALSPITTPSMLPDTSLASPPAFFDPGRLSNSPPQSEISASQPSHANSMAADARRERKLMDLEISNNSLMAINRSLEKEVKKQKAELRRFRRLTRSSAGGSTITKGRRESWLSDATSLTEISEEDGAFSDAEEDASEEEDNDSQDSDSLSPEALAQRDARHLRSDQERLHEELKKHKELLVDSQKMNLGLKKCIGLSEQLLRDANKALNYKVDVSDIKLGGRVLSLDELEESRFETAPETGQMPYMDTGWQDVPKV